MKRAEFAADADVADAELGQRPVLGSKGTVQNGQAEGADGADVSNYRCGDVDRDVSVCGRMGGWAGRSIANGCLGYKSSPIKGRQHFECDSGH